LETELSLLVKLPPSHHPFTKLSNHQIEALCLKKY
jgi:hypothetical protein